VTIILTLAVADVVVKAVNDPSPQDILKKVRDQYGSLSSYSDSGKTTNFAATFKLQLQRPNYYRFEEIQLNQDPDIHWSIGDGDFLLIRNTNFYKMRTMSLNPAAGRTGFGGLIPFIFFDTGWSDAGLPVNFRTLTADCKKLKSEDVDGVDCYVLTAIGPRPSQQWTFWVGKKNSLIDQEQERTEDANFKNLWTKTHENIATNRPFTKEDFVPQIPAGLKPLERP
jgi:outer membrane lipoprotein-sorting protein